MEPLRQRGSAGPRERLSQLRPEASAPGLIGSVLLTTPLLFFSLLRAPRAPQVTHTIAFQKPVICPECSGLVVKLSLLYEPLPLPWANAKPIRLGGNQVPGLQ